MKISPVFCVRIHRVWYFVPCWNVKIQSHPGNKGHNYCSHSSHSLGIRVNFNFAGKVQFSSSVLWNIDFGDVLQCWLASGVVYVGQNGWLCCYGPITVTPELCRQFCAHQLYGPWTFSQPFHFQQLLYIWKFILPRHKDFLTAMGSWNKDKRNGWVLHASSISCFRVIWDDILTELAFAPNQVLR